MSILDKIENAACEVKCAANKDDVSFDINDAVIESTRGFSKDAIQRVIEKVNVDNFLDVLGSGGDKSASFPLADSAIVFKKVSSSVLQKSAMMQAKDPGIDFYTKRRPVSKAQLPMEKCADLKLKRNNMVNYELQRVNILDKRAELFRDSINQCKDIYVTNFMKLAELLFLNEGRGTELVKQAKLKFGNTADLALGAVIKAARLSPSLLDVECTDVIYDDAEQSVKMFEQMGSAVEKIGQLNKMLAKCTEKRAGIFGNLFKKKQIDPYQVEVAASKKELIAARKDKARNRRSARMAPVVKGVKGLGAGVLGVIGGVIAGAAAAAPSMQPLREGAGWLEGKQQQEGADFKLLMDAANSQDLKFRTVFDQKKVITELLNEDEMLREHSPVTLVKLFDGLTRIAPNVATNKEITRAYLRNLSAQSEPTLDPYYAEQLVELNNAMSGAVNPKPRSAGG